MNGELTIKERIEKIREKKVTKLQRKLIEFLETNSYENIIYFSITEFALAAGVAEATVLRFCRSLGFGGYQDFKLSLAQEVGTAQKKLSERGYIHNICDNYMEMLDKCRQRVSPERVEQAVRYLLSARTISCFGVGNSYVPALELHNRLTKMGIYSQCERDLHLQSILLSSCGEKDLLVIFSVSGGTKDSVDLAAYAHKRGIKIIVVTSYEKSPLTKYADVVLAAVPCEHPVEAGSLTGKIVQIFLVDVICTGVYFSDKAHYDECIAQSNASVVGKLV
ncbi:MAG TPA: MurR/RpiR family transcriptional regulator [Candidatus Scatosoma pullicola]|nr:MurR/RpiR family transcriptional regulator [Candidatus Scatosoma pullicola]